MVAWLSLVHVQLIDTSEGSGEPYATRTIEADIIDIIGLYDGFVVCGTKMMKRAIIDVKAVVYCSE